MDQFMDLIKLESFISVLMGTGVSAFLMQLFIRKLFADIAHALKHINTISIELATIVTKISALEKNAEVVADLEKRVAIIEGRI